MELKYMEAIIRIYNMLSRYIMGHRKFHNPPSPCNLGSPIFIYYHAKIIVDEPHNHRIVWECWTTKGLRDEGNPNPRLQRI